MVKLVNNQFWLIILIEERDFCIFQILDLLLDTRPQLLDTRFCDFETTRLDSILDFLLLEVLDTRHFATRSASSKHGVNRLSTLKQLDQLQQ